MVRVILIVLLGFVVISCFPSPYYRLADGRKVIKSKYKNIKYFDSNIYKSIDINYFYIVKSGYLVDNKYKKSGI